MKATMCLGLTVLVMPAAAGVLRAQDPLGMVLMVSGEARLIRGQPAPARLGDLIGAGDVLEVTSGTATFVFCPEARRYVVSAGSTVRFSADGAVFSGPDPASAPSGPCSLPRVSLGAESLERVGGLRPRGKPPMEVYLGGTVSSGSPRFAWKPVESAELYRLQITDESGRRLWETATAASSVVYGEHPLPEGWYTWTLRAERGNEILAEQNTGFEVRYAGRQASPAADGNGADPGAMLLEAFRLENQGYPAEAAGIIRDLLEERPDDARLRRRLAWLYWKAGLLPAFQAELQLLPQDTEP